MAIGRLGPEYHTVYLNGVVRRTLELGGEHKARPSLRARWLSGARPLWLRGRAHAAAGVGDEEPRGVQARTECHEAAGGPFAMSDVRTAAASAGAPVSVGRVPRSASWFVIPARPPAARARIEEPSPDGTSAGR